MAWNEPGKPGDKDPWGQRRKPGADGPDLERIVKNIQQKFAALFGGKGGGPDSGHASGFGLSLIIAVAVFVWFLTGFYVVNQGERGVVLRFGAKTEITDAGLRWHLPYPIEKVEKVNVEKVSTIEIGYRSNLRSSGKSKVPLEALMLTEDENIIEIEFAVQYWVNDAANYVFNVRDQEVTIGQATESAVREVIGRSTLDYVFENRKNIEQNVKELLQKILNNYRIGVQIQAVEMQRAQPPEEVKSAFDDAVKAREDRERLKNEAEAYANDVIPRARGAAARTLQEAEGYKASVTARADGDARRFTQIANEYVKAPAVTRERLYIETMEQVLSSTTKIFIDQKAGNNLIYLPLDKMIPLNEAAAQTPSIPALTSEASDMVPSPPVRSGASGRSRADMRKR
ncbi:MAG: FtsH protease activity modulator HflK [Gammaproteobacteria bacterium]|nr:FtsH protease activity modulator HflK [Gammaproteobacteria bacterium]